LRAATSLAALLARDPYAAQRLPPGAKRVVTFLRRAPTASLPLPLPMEFDGARIVAMQGLEVFSAYVPSPRGAVFMNLIEKTFGKEVTTRTWDTIGKCVVAAG
jgi:uncharacterized protein (DUF1697 family)